MIVKVKSRKNGSFRQLLQYMLHDGSRLSGKKRGFLIKRNLRGDTIDGWVKQFEANERGRKVRRKDSVTMTHEVLSWHKDDAREMTPEKMEAMTREYIRLRGSRGGSFLAVPHYNKDHYHVHILVSGVDRSGKAMRMSRQEFGDLKRLVQEHQMSRFPELSRSVVEHGKTSKQIVSEKEYQMKVRTKKLSKREEIQELVHSLYTQSSSLDDFYARLKGCKLQVYERGGKVTGVMYKNMKLRFSRIGIDLLGPSRIVEQVNEVAEIRSKTYAKEYEI